MSDGFPVKSADNQPTRKRGRPKGIEAEFDAGTMARFESMGLFERAKSKRARDGVLYRTRALHLLTQEIEEGRLKWLVERDACGRGEKAWKPSVLAELGRINNPGEMLSVALDLCEAQPSIGDAVRMVKQYRMGGALKQGNGEQLADAIIGTVNRYLKEHPISWAEVSKALEVALLAVKMASEGIDDEEEEAA